MSDRSLKITATDGTYLYIGENQVVQVGVSANTLTNNILKPGRITSVKYLDGIAAAAPVLTVVDPVPAFTGGNTRYEIGYLDRSGTFDTCLSN